MALLTVEGAAVTDTPVSPFATKAVVNAPLDVAVVRVDWTPTGVMPVPDTVYAMDVVVWSSARTRRVELMLVKTMSDDETPNTDAMAAL